MTRKFQRYQLSKASRKFQKDLEKYIILLDEKTEENQAVKMMDAFGVLLKEFNEELIKIFY
jgi:5'-deoxynucleotidase YfbR-like HD superfamily hydrolase